MPRFLFKFIRISLDGENIENDTKRWTENILSENSVFKNFRISVDGVIVSSLFHVSFYRPDILNP